MQLINSDLNHALRVPLAAEIHSRPFLKLDAPELISHLAVYEDSDAAPASSRLLAQHERLTALCRHFGVSPPATDAKYFYHDFGRFRLKWECHTEFATFTFAEMPVEQMPAAQAFERMPLAQVPQQWLLSLKGKIMVAAHVVLERALDPVDVFVQTLPRVFEGNALVGSEVLEGGELWTDFAIQSDGFSRFVIRDAGMRAQQSGRLVQRLLEIETYRMMALLGLPHALQAAPALNLIENELADLAGQMVDTDEENGGGVLGQDGVAEQALLHQITRLAARIEKLSVENSYRFSASQAYFRLVNARIDELRERRVDGIPTVGEFMDRRLTPAMSTCLAMAGRQEALAQRIANTNDLLRTRVGIVQELQNRQILESLNARAAQQLRLQQAVEGLSVAAISYYVVGLLSYSSKAAIKALDAPLNPDVVVGVLVPLVALGVWLSVRQMRKHLHVD